MSPQRTQWLAPTTLPNRPDADDDGENDVGDYAGASAREASLHAGRAKIPEDHPYDYSPSRRQCELWSIWRPRTTTSPITKIPQPPMMQVVRLLHPWPPMRKYHKTEGGTQPAQRPCIVFSSSWECEGTNDENAVGPMGTWRLSRRVARQENGAPDAQRFAEWVETRATKRPVVRLPGRCLAKQRAGRVTGRVRHHATKVVARRSAAHGYNRGTPTMYFRGGRSVLVLLAGTVGDERWHDTWKADHSLSRGGPWLVIVSHTQPPTRLCG